MPRLDALRLTLARPSTTGALAGCFLTASVLLLVVAGHGLALEPGPAGWAQASGPPTDDVTVTGSIAPSRPRLDQQAAQQSAQRLGQGDGTARRAVDRDMDEVALRGSLAPASPEHPDRVTHRRAAQPAHR